MKSAADEGFHFSSCFKVIGIFKATGQTAGRRPAQLVERRGTAITAKPPAFGRPLLQMMKARRSPHQPGGTFPGGRQSFLNGGRPVASESMKGKSESGSTSFLLRFTQYSGLAEFGKGLLWEGNAQMSQLARPRSNTVPLTADHRLFLRVLG